jgi:hypothetical protein
MRSIELFFLISVIVSSCSEESSSPRREGTSQENDAKAAGGLGAKTDGPDGKAGNSVATSANRVVAPPTENGLPNFPYLYCEHAVKVKTRLDIKNELQYFCPDGAPSNDMLKLRETLFTGKGRTAPLIVKEKHIKETDRTEMVLIWGYYVKIRPFEVKERPLNEYIAKTIDRPDLKLVGTTKPQARDELDHGLHLWTSTLHYELSVQATSGLQLENKRNTQYNMYQVHSGNEEMGLGVESMVKEGTNDYFVSTMLNLSFNDGTGYNDGKGGTIVLNILNIEIDNRGFPATAGKSVEEIGKFLADAMYQGLTK